MNDLQATFDAITARQASRDASRETAAAANRERVRRWSPEFASMVDELKARSMFGRMVEITIHDSP